MRVMAAALITGQILFAGVVLWWLESQGPRLAGEGAAREPLQVVSWVALGMAIAAVPTAFVLRSQLRRRATTPQAMASSFLTFMAVLEGAGLLNLVAWMLLGPVPAHPLAAGALLAVQLVGCWQEFRQPGEPVGLTDGGNAA